MAFMCRPSPVFIEIAQKIVVWNGTWASNDGTFATSYETRGKAWGIRSLAHAIFLTPDGDAWKQAGRSALFRNAQLLKTFQDDPKSVLGNTSAGAYYPSYFWAALVAAVERKVAGADAAWSKVMNNVINLSAWSAGFGPDPRWGAYPRNK